MQQPKKELALLWSITAPDGRGERVIGVFLEGGKVMIFGGWSFVVTSENTRITGGEV